MNVQNVLTEKKKLAKEQDQERVGSSTKPVQAHLLLISYLLILMAITNWS